jgi:hypothetical protein
MTDPIEQAIEQILGESYDPTCGCQECAGAHERLRPILSQLVESGRPQWTCPTCRYDKVCSVQAACRAHDRRLWDAFDDFGCALWQQKA